MKEPLKAAKDSCGAKVMKYTISEMAALLGVTTHMLRYYEKIGIIAPEVNEQTGYRYYTVLDTRRFNLSRQLFSAGVPLETCAKLMNGMPASEIEQTLQHQIEDLRREKERIEIAIRYLQDELELVPVMEYERGKIYIEHLRPMWRLNLSMMEKADPDPALEQEKQKWLTLMPATFWVSKIPHDELRQFAQGIIEYGYGLMCYEDDARKLGLRRTPYVELVPGGDYAVLLHQKTDRGPWTWEDIRPMAEFLEKRGTNSFGDGFSYVVGSGEKGGVSVNFHKLMVKLIV